MIIRQLEKEPIFLPNLERYEPIYQDATAIRTFKECHRKYFWRFVLGLVPKTVQRDYILSFGTAYHKFREDLEFYWMREIKAGRSPSFPGALAYSHAPERHQYKPDIPTFSKKDLKIYSVERLLECEAHAFQYWVKEKANKKVEVLASEQIVTANMPDGESAACRVDQWIKWSGRNWIRDFKTTTKEYSMFMRGLDPNDQTFRNIYVASLVHGEPVGGIIFELIINHEGKKPEIKPVTIEYNEVKLKRWEQEQLFHNKMLRMCRDADMWPMSDCGNTGGTQPTSGNCAWCEYRELCGTDTEKKMEQKIRMEFACQPWQMQNVDQVKIPHGKRILPILNQ